MTMTPVAALLTGISGQRQTKIMEKNMRTLAYVFASVALAGFVATSAHAKPPIQVNCNTGKTIQAAVNSAKSGDTIFISGICEEDVSITKDDITLSGNKSEDACDKADPGGTGTIDGTVTVDGVRARIEFLTITGSGGGVDIINRANAHLTCNDISGNEAEGVGVVRSSNAVLRDNTVSGNGTRAANPFVFFDCGLFVADASSVKSVGNTYEDNRYCAISVNRQSSFKNGAFLPREAGHPANPLEKDVFTKKDGGLVAIDAFNGGLVDLRNAAVTGLIDISALSSFRAGGEVHIVGDIGAQAGSVVRVRNRNAQFDGDRQVTFDGALLCTGNSQVYSSSISCDQACTGIIGGDVEKNSCGAIIP